VNTPISEARSEPTMQEQVFMDLTNKYKNPLRVAVAETEELIQTIVTKAINQIIVEKQQNQILANEILRLRKLCDDNNIKHQLTQQKPPNRKERRAAEKKKTKTKKR